LADIIGTVFFWIILLFFIYIAADVLKLSLISDLINRIISFIPNLIAAVLIIIIGVLLSSFFKGMVKVAASSYALAHPELLSTIVQYLVLFFTLAIALEQLGVATQILVNSVLIIIGALAFGFALAFGLGSKDVAGKIINKILESEKTRGVSSGEISNLSEKENPNQTSDKNKP